MACLHSLDVFDTCASLDADQKLGSRTMLGSRASDILLPGDQEARASFSSLPGLHRETSCRDQHKRILTTKETYRRRTRFLSSGRITISISPGDLAVERHPFQ